ncbi:BON domain-containing protein [Simplicispira psychrophila]|uniref:BON domain-containing protein n=1 Tax=Simplicispira psychrophila TaxID=80882 RepID=UPI0004888353|nr:BON domain-containing protein [Simplicispira psychrophila]
MTRAVCALLAAAALGAGVAGCVPLVLGGAAIGGMMAVDRRTAGTQVEDEGIELRAANRVNAEQGERVHINVTSYNRQVLLTGEAPTVEIRQAIERSVVGVGNVLSVVNDLGVQRPSSLAQRSTDTFITGKVRASLVDAKDISASAFKVVTERNVVYLMGLVTEREAKRATSIARGVDGVRKVVRTFEILTEEQLIRLTTPQPAPVSTDRAVQPQPPSTPMQ